MFFTTLQKKFESYLAFLWENYITTPRHSKGFIPKLSLTFKYNPLSIFHFVQVSSFCLFKISFLKMLDKTDVQ